jgi:nicotinate-nucleotide adenylyltransferase
VTVTTAILGGRFDPPHLGHVALARAALAHFELDRLLVLVVVDPGHKAAVAPPDVRLELARLAFDSLPATVELDNHRFTVDLLEARPLDDPLFLIGADELAGFLSWKEPMRVLELARLGVATRPGYPRERLDAVLGQLERPERVELFELEPTPVSSTEVRERVSLGAPLDGLVPPAVAARIGELSPLYRGD